MLKKTLFLIAPLAPLAAVAAIVSAPAPAVGDTVCPPGANGHPTPCEKRCHPPHVVGRRVRVARHLMHVHGCRVRTTVIGKKRTPPNHFVTRLIVIKQKPKAGGYYAYGTRVHLRAKWEFIKRKPIHHKK